MPRDHQSDYGTETADLCERALLTLIGDIGPWRTRIYLAGGLAPRYIVGALPTEVSPHIGTTDADLVIGLSIGDAAETYATLQANLKKSGFTQNKSLSYRWSREVDGAPVMVEFLCETDQVEPGRIYRPKEGTGSKVGAFNVTGAQLATLDFRRRSRFKTDTSIKTHTTSSSPSSHFPADRLAQRSPHRARRSLRTRRCNAH